MAYTHYWNHEEIPEPSWDRIIKDVKRLYDSVGEVITAEYDTDDPPIADKDEIRFNGRGDDGYGTFYFPRVGKGFAYCKTDQRNYDKAVMVVLLLIKHHAGKAVQLSSDGEEDVEWKPAIEYVRKYYGYVFDGPILEQ